jgi:hypothetical protein
MGLIIYGQEGLGKTSLAAQFPKPLRFISVKESGYEDLEETGQIPKGCSNINVSGWQELLAEVKDGDDQKTLVIDSLSGVNQLMKVDILQHIYTGSQDEKLSAYGAFSDGARNHETTWIGKLEVLCTILRNKGVNIILIGHEKEETTKNVVSTDYKSSVIDMEKWPRSVLTKWAQAVLFLSMEFDLRITKKWKGVATEAKVDTSLEDEVGRIMYTTKHPSHSAKNRLGLPTFIMMGDSPQEAYENFVAKLPEQLQQHLQQEN